MAVADSAVGLARIRSALDRAVKQSSACADAERIGGNVVYTASKCDTTNEADKLGSKTGNIMCT